MIQSFKHKGLKDYFLKGESTRLNQAHVKRLRLVLAQLNAATKIQDMNFPGSGLHSLKGDKQDLWSVSVSGNYRVVFQFKAGDAFEVDYLDYH